MSSGEQARVLLREIRAELERLALWEPVPPPLDKLESTVPFAFDSLQFSQWLQWIFLPRTEALLDAGGRLPPETSIAPMGEWFVEQQQIDGARLVTLLEQFDALWQQA